MEHDEDALARLPRATRTKRYAGLLQLERELRVDPLPAVVRLEGVQLVRRHCRVERVSDVRGPGLRCVAREGEVGGVRRISLGHAGVEGALTPVHLERDGAPERVPAFTDQLDGLAERTRRAARVHAAVS